MGFYEFIGVERGVGRGVDCLGDGGGDAIITISVGVRGALVVSTIPSPHLLVGTTIKRLPPILGCLND